MLSEGLCVLVSNLPYSVGMSRDIWGVRAETGREAGVVRG